MVHHVQRALVMIIALLLGLRSAIPVLMVRRVLLQLLVAQQIPTVSVMRQPKVYLTKPVLHATVTAKASMLLTVTANALKATPRTTVLVPAANQALLPAP